MNSRASRSKQWLERQGYRVAITERWNPFARVRQDLYGIIDLLAIGPGIIPSKIWGIQVTGGGGDVAAHVTKALASAALPLWLQSGGLFSIIGWRKIGDRGKRKLWKARILDASLGPASSVIFTERPDDFR